MALPRRAERLASALVRFLEHSSRAFVLLVACLFVVLLGFVDWLTGPEVRFFIFYWPPIAMAAWFVGRRAGFALVGFAAVAWLAANLDAWGGERVALTAWNMSVNLASFALLALLIDRLHRFAAGQRHMALTDHLTGVANSRAFLSQVDWQLAGLRRRDARVCLVYLDVDDFKLVNDRLGHAAGDQCLRAVATELAATVRASDLVGRLGGDEFAVLFSDCRLDAARAALDRVHVRLSRLARETGWPISFSMGLVNAPASSFSTEALIAAADSAMYEAKRAGKNRIVARELGSAVEHHDELAD